MLEQILAVRSADAASTEAPSGAKTAEVTTRACHANVVKHAPVLEFQILAVLCVDAVGTKLPFDLTPEGRYKRKIGSTQSNCTYAHKEIATMSEFIMEQATAPSRESAFGITETPRFPVA